MKKTRFIPMLLGVVLSSGALLTAWLQSAQAALRAAPLPTASLSAASARPRGVRLTIYSSFRVTNSDDGPGDKDVEVYGNVKFGGQTVWNVARDNAISAVAVAITDPRRIICARRTFDVIFDDPKTWKIIAAGYMNDRDKASSNDRMWNSSATPRVFNLKDIYENIKRTGRREIILWQGDRKSESADLTLEITKGSDIF